MIRYLSEKDILLAHFALIERYGGSHGVRDIERIKSVVQAARQEVFGVPQYASLFEKSAVYARNIIGDHPFNDGNKRTGITVAVLFLQLNGVVLHLKKGELEDFAVRIAVERLDVPVIAAWLNQHSKS